MKQVTLSKDYQCAPEGHTVISFKAGDVLTGKAAELAALDNAVVTVGPTEIKPANQRLTNKRRK